MAKEIEERLGELEDAVARIRRESGIDKKEPTRLFGGLSRASGNSTKPTDSIAPSPETPVSPTEDWLELACGHETHFNPGMVYIASDLRCQQEWLEAAAKGKL
jgi:hypothetical protein